MAVPQHEAAPDWPEAWAPIRTLKIIDPDDRQSSIEFTCPCPSRGLRCGDCMFTVFGTPPFRATPLGWLVATAVRIGRIPWRIKWAIFGPPTDTED